MALQIDGPVLNVFEMKNMILVPRGTAGTQLSDPVGNCFFIAKCLDRYLFEIHDPIFGQRQAEG